MKFLCVIPARNGSKRVVNKNLKIIGGQPLVYWTLKLANQLDCFNKILLSTDSNRIFNLSKKFDKIDSVLRPGSISKDSSPMVDVINHSINFYKKQDIKFDAVVTLQPTSPFRKLSTIKKACKDFKMKKPDSLVSVVRLDTKSDSQHIINLNNKKYINDFRYNVGSKKISDYKLDGGVVFITKINKNIKNIIGGKTIFSEVTYPEAIDIDTNFDFDLAKYFMEKK